MREIFGLTSKGLQDAVFSAGKKVLMTIKPRWVAGEVVACDWLTDPVIVVACGQYAAIVLIYDRLMKEWREVDCQTRHLSDWKEENVREEAG